MMFYKSSPVISQHTIRKDVAIAFAFVVFVAVVVVDTVPGVVVVVVIVVIIIIPNRTILVHFSAYQASLVEPWFGAVAPNFGAKM